MRVNPELFVDEILNKYISSSKNSKDKTISAGKLEFIKMFRVIQFNNIPLEIVFGFLKTKIG